jgi:hypothetical protein
MLIALSTLLWHQCHSLTSGMFGDVVRPTVVHSSAMGGPAEAGATVVRSRAAWHKEAAGLGLEDERLAALEGLHGPLGAMDWNREMVVVVAAGRQSTGGVEIAPHRITTLPSGGWKLVARLSLPGPDEMVTMAMTSPYVVIRMPARRGQPSFYIERKVRGS